MPDLFEFQDLRDFGRDLAVTPESAAMAERVTWGWLKPVLGLTERPDPVPEEVFSWALQLGAIAHENPSGLEPYQLGAEQFRYSAEARAAVLAEAGKYGSGDTPAVGQSAGPVGCFPEPEAWPDPARR